MMKVRVKKAIKLMAAAVMLLCFCMMGKTGTVYGAELVGGMVSSNEGTQNYEKYGMIIKSYLMANADGTYTRVEFIDGQIVAEVYSPEWILQETKLIEMELPIFGGFYEGKDYYFIAFGQSNPAEDDTVETYRIVKYDKKFNRLGAASHVSNNTFIPMRASSLRMLQYGDNLYVRTARQMYRTADGYNHQANITFCIKISSMLVKDSHDKITYGLFGYTSHSFNQFLASDGDRLIAVDHGDNYPRAIRLCKSDTEITTNKIPKTYTYSDILAIQGEGGNNYTGASVGGLEVSESSYLVAGNSIVQDEGYQSYKTRNVFISTTPKNSVIEGASAMTWLTSYKEGTASTTTPHLVKLDNDRFMVLWQVMRPSSDTASTGYELVKQVNYVIVDGNGSLKSKVMTKLGSLSDCKPIYKDGNVLWYASDGQKVTLYSVTSDGNPEKVILSFDTLGGSLVESQELASGSKGRKPEPPVFSGYIFDGWSVSDENGVMTDYTFDSQVFSDTVLYAKWRYQSYTISYILNKGINSSSNPASYSKGDGSIVLQPATRENFDFEGWYSDKAFTTRVSTITAGSEGNLKLYAKWKRSIPVVGTTYAVGKCSYTVTSTGETGGTVAFEGVSVKNLTKLTIPATVKINTYVFSVTEVESNALSEQGKLKKLIIGDNVVKLGVGAFSKCTALSKVTLGKSVSTIGENLFAGDSALSQIIINSEKITNIGKNSFSRISEKAKLTVPKNQLDKYKTLFGEHVAAEKLTAAN